MMLEGSLQRCRVFIDWFRLERFSDQTLDMFPQGILLTDKKTRVLGYNTRAKDILHLPDDIPNKRLTDVLNLGDLPELFKTNKNQLRDVECTITDADGSPAHLVVSLKTGVKDDVYGKTLMWIIGRQKDYHSHANRIAGYRARYTYDSIIGESEAMKRVMDTADIAAKSDANLLIFGESGTGKELFAQAIHNAGKRANGPFVAVNCGSIPKDMVETELFGQEGGIIGDRVIQGNPGKFELANGGTLFLDEVSNMSLETQAALLRILQTREAVRIGGVTPRKIDVRIIATTNTNLMAAVTQGTFRSDLYYRLNVLNLTIPPLRSRKDDILPLAQHIIRKNKSLAKTDITGFEVECKNALLAYRWPGNVRELENVIERAIHLGNGSVLKLTDLPYEVINAYLSDKYETMPQSVPQESAEIISPELQEYQQLKELLIKQHGHVKTIAVMLGMPVSTLYRKLNKYDLNPKDFKMWNSY